jgi:hypothetical protein
VLISGTYFSLGAAFGILFFRNWVAWDQHSLQPVKLLPDGAEVRTFWGLKNTK